MPLEVDVESEATELLVDDSPLERDVTPLCVETTELLTDESPVESELTPLCALLIPLDAEVESALTRLVVVERPVESEPTPL